MRHNPENPQREGIASDHKIIQSSSVNDRNIRENPPRHSNTINSIYRIPKPFEAPRIVSPWIPSNLIKIIGIMLLKTYSHEMRNKPLLILIKNFNQRLKRLWKKLVNGYCREKRNFLLIIKFMRLKPVHPLHRQ